LKANNLFLGFFDFCIAYQPGQAALKQEKLITKARNSENTKKDNLNFVLSPPPSDVFVIKKSLAIHAKKIAPKILI
jgi:hypothetical protein